VLLCSSDSECESFNNLEGWKKQEVHLNKTVISLEEGEGRPEFGGHHEQSWISMHKRETKIGK